MTEKIERRDFLKTSIAVAGSAAEGLPRLAPAAAGSPASKLTDAAAIDVLLTRPLLGVTAVGSMEREARGVGITLVQRQNNGY